MRDLDIINVAHYRKEDDEIQEVKEHLLAVSDTCERLSAKLGLSACGRTMGLLHDFGKYGELFQKYIKSSVGLYKPAHPCYVNYRKLKGKIDHATIGAQWVCNNMECVTALDQATKEFITLCICSHHGGLIDCLSIDGEDAYSKRMQKLLEYASVDKVNHVADAEIIEAVKNIRFDELTAEISRIIAEVNKAAQYNKLCNFGLFLVARYLFSCLIDADRTDTADFELKNNKSLRALGQYLDWSVLVDIFEVHNSDFIIDSEINIKRSIVSDACYQKAMSAKGLFYLTVPTGGGKTLAVLRFALHHARKHKMSRIIYVIPYTSIIDQNAETVRKIFNGIKGVDVDEIVLEHHSNLAESKDTKLNRLLSENWDAPIVFTTSVQLLESLFGGRTRGARRMHALANSVVIFDEVQTLPIKTVHLFNNAINFLTNVCSSSVVFCTATQPLLHDVDPKKGAVSYCEDMELVRDQSLFKEFRKVEVVNSCKPSGWCVDEMQDAIAEKVAAYGSVLVITNTKKDAERIFGSIKELSAKRFFLSTKMCPAHRMDVLSELKKHLDPVNPKPVVCVSTQLIEAGVDVDFGCVFRSLAGIDSIAQAAGRCNRENKRSSGGKVVIVNLKGENLDKLPDIRIAQEKAERVINDFNEDPDLFDNSLISKKAVELYYSYYFYERSNEMVYNLHRSDFGRDDDLLSLLSTNRLSEKSARAGGIDGKRILKQSFKSACDKFEVIDAPTIGVIVPYKGVRDKKGYAEKLIADLLLNTDFKMEKVLRKKLQQYSVNIFSYERDKLMEQRTALCEVRQGSGIYALAEHYYCPQTGLNLEPVSLMPFCEV
ncbi:MAG: CRISPR-associated helicase Cas3' [Kiritimatiellae bacterium]|nr:CRISPR-associated helicase Cas3' [Kiritimatiellia bacterium]